MIRRDYKDEISMDSKLLADLKAAFPAFFRKDNPEPLIIHIKDEFFYPVQKSIMGSQEIHKAQYTLMKEAPQHEDLKLMYQTTFQGKSGLYTYSTTAPVSKDNQGLKFEFEWNSGIYFKCGHKTMLQPGQDTELLYFLYYLCPEFANGKAEVKNEITKYTFHQPHIANASRRKNLQETAELIQKLDALSDEDVSRILRAMFQPVTDDAAGNFNWLHDVMKSATDEQKATFDEMTKSVEKEEAKITDGTIADWITKWMDEDNIRLVEKETEEDKVLGWLMKGAKNGPQAGTWLKTPLCQLVPGAQDQRIALAEYLANNTEQYEKLKTRW